MTPGSEKLAAAENLVRIVIDEGPLYRLERFAVFEELGGARCPPAGGWSSPIKAGDVFSRHDLARDLESLRRAYRDLGRVATLARLSLSALRRRASRLAGRLFLSRAKQEARDRVVEAQAARENAKAMGDMKGVLMKVGQIVSFMDDAVPEAYRTELAKLQTQAPPMDWEVVEATLRLELGDDYERHFSRVERRPLASASIGQVHAGTLREEERGRFGLDLFRATLSRYRST